MWKVIFPAICLVWSSVGMAQRVDCAGDSIGTGNFAVPQTGLNITLPNTGDGGVGRFLLLYSATKTDISSVRGLHINCTPITPANNYPVNSAYTIKAIPAGNTYYYDGYTIYPTSVKGIGISINDGTGRAGEHTIPVYPDRFELLNPVPVYPGGYPMNFVLNIRIWKTPERTPIPVGGGMISFTGPTVTEIIYPTNSADVMGNCPSSKGPEGECYYAQRQIIGSAQFIASSCEFINTVQTVDMGKFNGARGENSSWKDASFSLKCPDAYGYGGSIDGSNDPKVVGGNTGTNPGTALPNNIKNNTVQLRVVPRTTIINNNQGVIALNAGGAEGYGLQLAWGLPSEQTDNPINPVQFNTLIKASDVSSNFSAGPYDYGGNAVVAGSDGSIKMAARYVRTTGNVLGGQANTSIEIQADYE